MRPPGTGASARQRSARERRVGMAAIVAVLGLLLMGMPPSGAGPASGVAPPPALTGGTASAPSTPSVGSAWPMFMGNIEHTSEQLGAMGLNLSSAPKIQMLWNYTTGGDVVGEPAVLNNSVYFGSWDGKEYAVDANNGTLRWATYTGQSQCTVTSGYNGITSSASLARGLVYVGGGGEYWEAISQSNGSIV
ncbi:MAG TPA: PQQ-binding-like beta-propeller repeat protein, partial [Thermoplasmata archaeon]|nr:PQQ-binding-like beta-propeller repeat protein [Thermoplasmata archaeon]